MNNREIKQVIVIRTDLKNSEGNKIRTGKLIAQGSHASLAFLTRKAEVVNGHFTNKHLKNLKEVIQWCEEGFTKICLKVNSEKELMEIYSKAIAASLNCELIVDSGYTEFGGKPTKTCIGIGPNRAEDIDKITGHLGLL